MPRTPRFKVAAIAELFRQLEYAPPETRTRQMDATERLIADIDSRQNYPEDFVTFRITGYRSDRAEESATLVGEALLPDLVNLVLLLSRALSLPLDFSQRQALSLTEVAVRLKVSTKSVQRYRRHGLVFHYVHSDRGKPTLICFEDALQRFADGHREHLEQQPHYSRIGDETESRIVAEAAELRTREHLTLNQAAKRLAAQHGRAIETIRQLLRRHDCNSKSPIFRQNGPLDNRRIELVYRAWRFGVEPELIAKRLGKSKATIHRAVNRRRAELLSSLDLSFVRLPTFDMPDADNVILSAPSVRRGLDAGFVDQQSVVEWIGSLPKASSSTLDQELDALLAGYNFLKMTANAELQALGRTPASESLDTIETSLRWATMLKRLLLVRSLPTALRRIEHNLHRPLTHQTPAFVNHAVAEAVRIASRTIERVDPGRDQELGRMVSQAMDRSLARKPISESVTASDNQSSECPTLSDHLGTCTSWHWLSLPIAWRSRTGLLLADQSLGEIAHRAIARRHGWNGEHPRTIAEIAADLNITPIGTVRLLRRAEVFIRRTR